MLEGMRQVVYSIRVARRIMGEGTRKRVRGCARWVGRGTQPRDRPLEGFPHLPSMSVAMFLDYDASSCSIEIEDRKVRA